MSESKYPYIPDKKMYAAVMGACSYIRETGYFNKAVSYYADKFNVSEEELAHQIRLRQGAGQRGRKPSSAGKKYKWYIVGAHYGTYEATIFDCPPSEFEILRGLSSKSVKERFSESDFKYDRQNDTGSDYSSLSRWHTICGKFDTKEEAQKALSSWRLVLQKKETEEGILKGRWWFVND